MPNQILAKLLGIDHTEHRRNTSFQNLLRQQASSAKIFLEFLCPCDTIRFGIRIPEPIFGERSEGCWLTRNGPKFDHLPADF